MTDHRHALTGTALAAAAGIDTSTASPARIYDYLLGGKDNFPADRAVADEVLAVAPKAREVARTNRAFLQRAVRVLAGQAGVRQFLDIGTGLPTQGNVHEVAQAIAPDTRVVYVDNDPIVYVHANALLADNTTTVAIRADLREPDAILQHPQVRRMIDFNEPVAVLLVAVLHFIPDEEGPAWIVARLRDAMCPGSFLVISHASGDFHPDLAAKVAHTYEQATAPLVPRRRGEIERFFDGFELVTPGLVEPGSWRPDPDSELADRRGDLAAGYGGAGCKRWSQPDRL